MTIVFWSPSNKLFCLFVLASKLNHRSKSLFEGKISGISKFSRLQSSPMLFISGVPVISNLLFEGSFLAMIVHSDSEFFSLWASSKIT